MVSVEKIYEVMRAGGVDFFTGVPDSLLKSFCAYVTDHADGKDHIIAANEGAAVGIAAGHYMAGGHIPVVYMQNSGLGNTVNPLLSLADGKVYSIPELLVVGWRGEPGVKDEPQHVKQGEVTLALLKAMQIPYVVMDADEGKAVEQLQALLEDMKTRPVPHAVVVRKDLFGKYQLQKKSQDVFPLSREEALKLVAARLQAEDVVVSTTGKLSRELFEYREAEGQGHASDFLTVGSMGHASSIALGIALEKPGRRVFCLDGDGAFLMHMGAVTNIGCLAPGNYFHILFNNGAHESVGGQPTLGLKVCLPEVARACGYRHAVSAATREEMEEVLDGLSGMEGPVLVELKVRQCSRSDLGRPTTTPQENRRAFMDFLDK